jgi:hypothetical protein
MREFELPLLHDVRHSFAHEQVRSLTSPTVTVLPSTVTIVDGPRRRRLTSPSRMPTTTSAPPSLPLVGR